MYMYIYIQNIQIETKNIYKIKTLGKVDLNTSESSGVREVALLFLQRHTGRRDPFLLPMKKLYKV